MDSQEAIVTSPSLAYSEESVKKSSPWKKIFLIIFFIIILAGIPAGTYLLQKTQILKSKASSDISTIFTLPGYVQIEGDPAGLKYKTSQVDIAIGLNPAAVSVLGDQLSPAPAQSSTAAPVATSTPAATATPGTGTVASTSTPVPPTAVAATATSVPTVAKPADPSGLTATCVNATQISLSWSPVSNAQSYWYWVSSVGYQSTTDYFAIVNISSGVNYDWSVAAKNASVSSNSVSGSQFHCP